MNGARRGLLLLAIGAGLGVCLAASGLVARERATGLGADAVAVVNGQPVLAEDYQRILGGLVADRRGGELAAEDRQRVLDRLIDETLLVERGLELGLVWRDGKVRKDLVAAVIDAVVADRSQATPSDADVDQFYAEHRDFFARPGRLHLRQVWCAAPGPGDDGAARARAEQAASRLRAGEDFATVRAALGDAEIAALPDGLLPPQKLVEYLGPTALRTAFGLAPGAVSDPVRSNSGWHVLQLVERQGDEIPPLAEIRAEVEAEVRRRAGDQALIDYVADLRRRAAIETRKLVP